MGYHAQHGLVAVAGAGYEAAPVDALGEGEAVSGGGQWRR